MGPKQGADLGLGTLDISLFVLALAVSVLIGVYFANKNSSLEQYMMGGRDQRLLPVAMSMMTSFLSGVTLIGSPAELYHHGPGHALLPIAMILAAPINALIFLPVFYRLGHVSVFTYLESRYCPAAKRIVSLLFVVQMTLYNAVVLYVPSLSLKSIFGISEQVSIGAVGAACLVYCTLGGVKAVIWTDFFQAGLMYLSLVCLLVGGAIGAGGFSMMLQINRDGGRLDLDHFLNFDLATRHTLFNVLTGSLLINVFTNGTNQIQVQRAMSLPSLRLGQLSQLLCALFSALLAGLASSVGLVLYANYARCDPFGAGQIDKRDAIVIYYVKSELAWLAGLRGLFIAGIFAATLSTLSSFQNSMAALVIEDFIKPTTRKPLSDRAATNLSKLIALLFGLACIGLAFVVGSITGLLQAALTLFGALGSPLVASYLLGMLTRFVNSAGMLVGMLAGYTFGIYIQFYQIFYLPPLEPTLPLSTAGCASMTSRWAGRAGQSGLGFNSSIVTPTAAPPAGDEFTGCERFVRMSYLWLPVFSVAITTLVASLFSVLTGGLSQQVDDKYLVSFLHREGQLGAGGAGRPERSERPQASKSCRSVGADSSCQNTSSPSYQLRAQVNGLCQELKRQQRQN